MNNYIVTFKPNTINTCKAKLNLNNNYTNDVFEYELVGMVEEPLAMDHIIIKCIARKTAYYEIEIVNPYKDKNIVYQVETDLLHFEGLSHFIILPGKTYRYLIAVNPVLGGVYTGSINFFEEGFRDKYFWYY